MMRSTVNPLGRLLVAFALTLSAMFGSVALATAASADVGVPPSATSQSDDAAEDDGGVRDVSREIVGVISGPGASNGNGPQAFVMFTHGRQPIFYCDPAKPKKRHAICVLDPRVGGPRF